MASIFISYSTKDKAIVERIYQDLSKADVEVWLDEREIKVGDDIRQKIEQGIKNFDFFGIVLSKSSVQSAWVQNELSAAYVKEMESKKVTILPIKIEECDVPALISGKKYADLSGDYSSGLSDLLKVLSHVKIREMNFPKTTIHLARRGQSSTPPQPIAFTCYSTQSGAWDLAILIESIGDKEAKSIVTDACFQTLNSTYQQTLDMCAKNNFPVKFLFYQLFLLINITASAALRMDVPAKDGRMRVAGAKASMLYRIHDRVFSTRIGDCGGVAGWELPNNDFMMRRIDPTSTLMVAAPTGYDWPIGQTQSAPLGFISFDDETNKELNRLASNMTNDHQGIEKLDFEVIETRLNKEEDFIALSSFVMPKFDMESDNRMSRLASYKHDKKKLANYLCELHEPSYSDCVVALMSIR